MARRIDLATRLRALKESWMCVVSDYKSNPAKWLKIALEGCDLRVINAKGVKADDTIVMLRLSMLEELVTGGGLVPIEASLSGTEY